MINRYSGYIYIKLLLIIFIIPGINYSILASDIFVNKGIIHLSDSIFNHNNHILLRGTWELYWNQLLAPEEIDSTGISETYMPVPGKWNSVQIDGKKLPGYGCLTLRTKIFTDVPGDHFSLKFIGIGTAGRVFLNNKLIYEAGTPGISKKTSEPGTNNGYIHNLPLKKENDLVIQISNFNVKYGGIEDIYIGKTDKISHMERYRARTVFFLFGSILMMALYHIGLFIIRRKNISALYFGLFAILLAIRTIIVTDRLMLDIIKIRWELMHKIEYLTYYLAVPAFIYFVKSVFLGLFSKYMEKAIVIVSLLFSLIVIVLPSPQFTYTLLYFQIITGIIGIYITYISVLGVIKKQQEAMIFLIGWLIMFFCVINDILYYNELLHISSNLTSVGLFIFIIFQAYLLASQFTQTEIKSEKLAKKLNYTNRNLSKIVDFRTSELEKQKQTLVFQKIEIENKNKDITDSINYASKIQKAVLPHEELFQESFDDYFIYYQPKDIVSGDFYWIKRMGNKIIVLAADCTGHGVPGAFMSLLGIAFLNEIVNMITHRQDIQDSEVTSKILHELRKKIKGALRQTGEIDEAFDGIDMALCMVNYAENKLYYSGANNSLYVVTNHPKIFNPKKEYIDSKNIILDKNKHGVLAEIRANRMPIGTYLSEKPFTCYELNLDELDAIYMFSDGYADQLGGENNTKFRLKKFKQLILDNSNKPMKEQQEILESTMEEWKSKDIGQIDDITVIGIKLHADREERSFGIF